jgi:hypothetical protein
VQIDPLTEDGVTQLAEREQTTRLQQAINLSVVRFFETDSGKIEGRIWRIC